jgi:hypothetical protein
VSAALPVSVHMTSTTCWCGLPFACPTELYSAAKDGRLSNGEHLHCPIGHGISCKTRVQELERQVAELNRICVDKDRKLTFANNETAAVRRTLKRVTRRAKAGVCLECHRTFSNVARHMATKHPDVKP